MSATELHCKGFDHKAEINEAGKRIIRKVFCPYRWSCRRYQAHIEDMMYHDVLSYFKAGECMYYDYRQLKKI